MTHEGDYVQYLSETGLALMYFSSGGRSQVRKFIIDCFYYGYVRAFSSSLTFVRYCSIRSALLLFVYKKNLKYEESINPVVSNRYNSR